MEWLTEVLRKAGKLGSPVWDATCISSSPGHRFSAGGEHISKEDRSKFPSSADPAALPAAPLVSPCSPAHAHAQRTTHNAQCRVLSAQPPVPPLTFSRPCNALYIVQPTMGWPVDEKKKYQKFYDIFQVSAFFFSESNCSFKNNLRLAVSWFLSSFFLLLPFLLLFIPLVPLNMQTLQLFSFILNCTGGHIKSVFLIDVPPLHKKNLDHMYIGIYG